MLKKETYERLKIIDERIEKLRLLEIKYNSFIQKNIDYEVYGYIQLCRKSTGEKIKYNPDDKFLKILDKLVFIEYSKILNDEIKKLNEEKEQLLED